MNFKNILCWYLIISVVDKWQSTEESFKYIWTGHLQVPNRPIPDNRTLDWNPDGVKHVQAVNRIQIKLKRQCFVVRCWFKHGLVEKGNGLGLGLERNIK